MNCIDILPLLSGHLDHMNTDTEDALLEAHLKDCAKCRATLAAMERNDRLLAADLASPPEDLTVRIMKEVRAPAKKSRFNRRALVSWIASSAAAAALFGFVFLQPDSPAKELAPSVPETYALEFDSQEEDNAICYAYTADPRCAQEVAGTEAPHTTEFAEDSDTATPTAPVGDAQPTMPISPTEHYRLPMIARPDWAMPILFIWDADPADFPLMDDYTPEDLEDNRLLLPKEIWDDESFMQRLNEVLPHLEQETIESNFTTTWTVYTLPYEMLAELVEACGEDYETILYDPESFMDAEECKIIFSQRTSVPSLEPQTK